VFVQKFHPVHRQGYRTEILLHRALEDIGAHFIQHVAELIIHFREEHGFIEAGGILKGDKASWGWSSQCRILGPLVALWFWVEAWALLAIDLGA
jgi:hypothetical protein